MEIQNKLQMIRTLMKQSGLSAVHLRGVDWFSWITGGGTSVVIMTSEVGVAEVLVTETEAWILTTVIEKGRLENEEVSGDFRITSFAWQDTGAQEKFIFEKVGPGKRASDRPQGNEEKLPPELQIYKMKMQVEEVIRYRKIGKLAAEAMTEAMAQARPEWTENQLAGAGAKALWSRGLEPTLILVAGEKRRELYRHPISKDSPVGDGAMMVFCARGFGLYANLTRFIFFRDLKPEEQKRFDSVRTIEAQGFQATRPGQTLAQVYEALAKAYRDDGVGEEINHHHQGGPTGYLSRELVAKPEQGTSLLDPASHLKIESGMVFAWNPSLPGAKIEDTVLLTQNGIEVLTVDEKWPSVEFQGLKRPQVWIRK